MVPKRLSGVLEAFASRARSCVELHSGGACSSRHGLIWAGYKTSITEPLPLVLLFVLLLILHVLLLLYFYVTILPLLLQLRVLLR